MQIGCQFWAFYGTNISLYATTNAKICTKKNNFAYFMILFLAIKPSKAAAVKR